LDKHVGQVAAAGGRLICAAEQGCDLLVVAGELLIEAAGADFKRSGVHVTAVQTDLIPPSSPRRSSGRPSTANGAGARRFNRGWAC